MVSRGEICWLELPEEGKRPVLVLTRAQAIPVLRNVVVALVTRTIRDIPTELRLTEDDGMPGECAVSFDNLRTVPKALLGDSLVKLSGDQMHRACRALSIATACG
jgi:mRNA interferase MazF